ncbi:MAG: restriction endonuclease, partial [Nostoc sp.]
AKLGDRSIELEEKKSNYQAGTDFENIARQSLEFLGFKVENAYKGGAGGLDLFCSKPYPIVCECKAGRLIPSGTVEELIKLGGMHLGADQFLDSAKLVIGPGNPSTDILKAAQKWKVSIINAMTLQKLVEFKAKYPGAINLVELQQYLQPGQID